jgi:DNA-directed RNA polymerase sigma subunit (sigma70/sigma32)
MLSSLDERDADIVRRRFGFGSYETCWTLKQIGQAVGLTRERVRQITSASVMTLRSDPRAQL